MDKVLIICGPTATGKTKFALEVAKKFKGELVSADSRQVYVGKNLVYGKDLPSGTSPHPSRLKWRGRRLSFYGVDGIKIWLYDVVNPGEPFSVAFWKECADLVITDIIVRHHLPIVVGGSGLYLKSLSQSLFQISIHPLPELRRLLADKSVDYLFDYLNKVDPSRAASLNRSDRANPRRLLRAIEISLSDKSSPRLGEDAREAGGEVQTGSGLSFLQIGLTAPRVKLYAMIDDRVHARIAAGAAAEDPAAAAHPVEWQAHEHGLARRQLTWFRKQPAIHWFDITGARWQAQAEDLIASWYNNPS